MTQPFLDKQSLRSLVATLAFIWLGCAVFVALEQLSGFLTYREFTIDPLQRIHFITVFYWLPWLVFAPCIAVLSRRVPIRPDAWVLPVGLHTLLLLVLMLVHSVAFSYTYHFSSYLTPLMATFEPWQHSGHFLFGDDAFLFIVIFYFVIAASLNTRSFLEIVRRQEYDANQLSQNLAELKLQTLRMQVNPHFLFNALNSIAVLVRKKETDEAGEMINRLGHLFRSALDTSRAQWVSLEDELEVAQQYIGIAKIRFGDRLEVCQFCDDSARHVPIPAMLLQPLIENAFTHGLSQKVGACKLSLSVCSDGDRIRIEIVDDGVGGRFHADPDFQEGVGLSNVCARLKQMYGDEHSFRLNSTPGEGTRITIELPRCAPASLSVAV